MFQSTVGAGQGHFGTPWQLIDPLYYKENQEYTGKFQAPGRKRWIRGHQRMKWNMNE
jgi:hypothetical protein